MTPIPLIMDDHDIPTCTAMKAPDEIPEIELSLMSAL